MEAAAVPLRLLTLGTAAAAAALAVALPAPRRLWLRLLQLTGLLFASGACSGATSGLYGLMAQPDVE